jgi:hypothetical protein
MKIKVSNLSISTLLVFFCVSLFIQCKKEEPIIQTIDTSFHQDFPIVYNATLPEGKSPYPHHDPTISQDEYQSLVNDLFIINNYGLYQCGESPDQCYFHDGLDFVLTNGTPIFAIKAGTVRANIGGSAYYRTLVVEDADTPGMAWSYTHVYFFDVSPGEEVEKGQFLGRVNFQGLDHIHLSRTRLKEGGTWRNFEDLINVYPDDYFTFIDEQAPIIKTPFNYFPNLSDAPFTNDTIFGEVDIVVSMRDIGRYAGGWIGNGYWGDRLAVRDISYRILKDGVEIFNRKSFDFRKMEFRYNPYRWRETMTVFKHHTVLDPDAGNNNAFHSHYIITNAKENLQGEINPQDENLAWNTLELDAQGQAKYPNGLYQIEVTAHDSNGNKTVQVDEVYIDN